MTPYDFAWYFVIYSFAGWIIEVIYQAVCKGKILNRGFLNGPVCPVYGFGMSAVLLIYYSLNTENFLIIFLEGFIFTTLIELFAGFVLDKCFHARWWDYSKMPMNLNGYICLAFSIIWGLAVTFAIKVVHPNIQRYTSGSIPPNIGWPILVILYLIFIVDTVITIMILIGLNKKLKELDEISQKMRRVSDRMSTRIGEDSLKTAQKVQEGRVQAALAKAEAIDNLEEIHTELSEKYEQLKDSITKHKYIGAGRLLDAYPKAHHQKYKELFSEVQTHFKNKHN